MLRIRGRAPEVVRGPPLRAWDVAALLAMAALSWRSWAAYRRWPELAGDAIPASLGTVSIVVPARDEAENLMRLLPSLLCLEPPPSEVLVVDDRSHDQTATVAAGFGIRVLQSTEPPPGWSGKNWACRLGAEASSAEWLLFTDADTWHAPESLVAALSRAKVDGADLLSVLTGQECRSLWERLVLPFAYAHYFAAAAPEWANDDRAPSAIANGQYLLLRRTWYDRIGGHAAVRASLGEDVELARLVRRAGGRVRLYRADALVRVRMYRSLGAIQTGFRKYMAGYLRAYPPHGALVAASTATAGLPLLWLIRAASGRTPWWPAAACWLVGVGGYLPWLRWFGVHPVFSLLQPLAYAVFQAIALDAGVRSLLGLRVTWKGRRYRA